MVEKSDDNLMAAVSYLLGILTGIVVYIMYKDKGNKFVLFHAVQSIIYGVALIIAFFVLMVVNIVLAFIPVIGWIIGLVMMLVWLALCLAIFASWIFLMYKAYTGEKFMLPVIGKMAEKYA
ncbi:MAG: hypothetical protein V1744_00345 [Candidatus Altiarchaeota archaeon]